MVSLSEKALNEFSGIISVVFDLKEGENIPLRNLAKFGAALLGMSTGIPGGAVLYPPPPATPEVCLEEFEKIFCELADLPRGTPESKDMADRAVRKALVIHGFNPDLSIDVQ